MQDRRSAPRHSLPEGVTAHISGIDVQIIDLSASGAKVEHTARFPLPNPLLNIAWNGQRAAIASRAVRSELVGKRGPELLYNTGLSFVDPDDDAKRFLESLLARPEAPIVPPREPQPSAPQPDLDDSWIRRVTFHMPDEEEHLPYAQFRLTPNGWQKEYVASPVQPEDGFTIRRERSDFDEMQRTFEAADPDTRRMMRIALESESQR